MITIHEPAVVLTDLGLAVLGGVFAWRLRWPAPRGPRPALLLGGLASAALWGAVFHAFFPAKTATPGGHVVWMLVALSIVVVTGVLLSLVIAVRRPDLEPRVSRSWAIGFATLFAAVIVFVDESFRTIVRFFGPVLLVTVIVAIIEAAQTGSRAWALIAVGLGLSGVAAVLQQAGVALHATYFDHNAVYHVVQAGALVVLYRGFRHGAPDPAVAR